jgi:hypothetical protein
MPVPRFLRVTTSQRHHSVTATIFVALGTIRWPVQVHVLPVIQLPPMEQPFVVPQEHIYREVGA